ncbi:hypothetical protein [Streptomyces sp. NPDC086010]|uniref:hypothetical protein n=1 Tax=Streptomyces sp. NPDC086010 TaxID=3365745 RepID=UPI0037D355E6
MNVTPVDFPRRETPSGKPDHSRWLRTIGWLGNRIDDIDTAFTLGWHRAALWIKTLSITAAVAATVGVLYLLGGGLLAVAHALPWTTQDVDHTGLLATIDEPVHRYLAAHTTVLPVSAVTAYATWQAAGAVSFVLGFLYSSGARIVWTLWGGATTAMVWTQTPASGRDVAAGITVLAWAALSLLALRGLRLIPASRVNVDVQAAPAPQVHAVIQLPATTPTPPSYRTAFDPKQPPALN